MRERIFSSRTGRTVRAYASLGMMPFVGGFSAETEAVSQTTEMRPSTSTVQTVTQVTTGGVDLDRGQVILEKRTVKPGDMVTQIAVDQIHAAGKKSTRVGRDIVTAFTATASSLKDADIIVPGKQLSIPDRKTVRKLVEAGRGKGDPKTVAEVKQLADAIRASNNNFNDKAVREEATDVIQTLTHGNTQPTIAESPSTNEQPSEAQSPNTNTVPQVSRGGIIESPEQPTNISTQQVPTANETNDNNSPWVPLVPLSAVLLAASAVVGIGYNSLKKKYPPDPEKKSGKEKFLTWLKKGRPIPQETQEDVNAWLWEDGILAKLKASPYRPYQSDESCYFEYFRNTSDVERILDRMNGQLDKQSKSHLEAFKENIFNKDNLVLVVYLEEPKWGYKLIPRIDVIEIPNEESLIATGEIPVVTGTLTYRTLHPGIGRDTQERPLVRG